jgi:hypothetical protein
MWAPADTHANSGPSLKRVCNPAPFAPGNSSAGGRCTEVHKSGSRDEGAGIMCMIYMLHYII